MILLDTDILVDVLRRYKPALVWLETIEDEIALPGFAAMELVRGCKNKSEQDAVEKTLNRVRILWLSEKGCSKAYEQFLKLHLWSEISMFDVLRAIVNSCVNFFQAAFRLLKSFDRNWSMTSATSV